jgi:hypothetical protein
MHGRGFTRNLGGPPASASSSGRRPRRKQPGVPRERPSAGRTKHGRRRGNAPRERGATGMRASEHLIVPARRGNRPDGTPRREGDAGTETRRRDRR